MVRMSSQEIVLAASRATRLFGPGVAVMASPLIGDVADLHPDERASIADAVPLRQREFATGRVCARRLLARFGIGDVVLPMDTDGRPLWPAGYLGSISHAAGQCVVAVAPRSEIAGIGVDIEDERNPIADAAWDVVCTPAELAGLHRQPSPRRPGIVSALFSAKESTYKCLDSRPGRPFEPREIEIDWDGESATYRAELVHHTSGQHALLRGTITVGGGWVLTGMIRAPV
jgi:4'-phosphopantetheinyl transferase EntD